MDCSFFFYFILFRTLLILLVDKPLIEIMKLYDGSFFELGPPKLQIGVLLKTSRMTNSLGPVHTASI